MNRYFALIGSAFGHGAKIYSTGKSPHFLKEEYQLHKKLGDRFKWEKIVSQGDVEEKKDDHGMNYAAVLSHVQALSKCVQDTLQIPQAFPIIIGGDHSCAIGTWSGVVTELHLKEEFGLIWVDAHMDSHTPKTSSSKSYHGMPVSHLLGYGDEQLCSVGCVGRKIKPENLVFIGIRSYEKEERDFLEKNKVKVFYMEDIETLGIKTVVEQALAIVTKNTKGFGVSIDMDAFDPSICPGTGSVEPNGILFDAFSKVLPILFSSPLLKCLELAEFDPNLDIDCKTANVIKTILEILRDTKQ